MSSDDFAKRIKDLRKKHNLTLEEVGNRVGVGKSTVRKWETGAIANMRRDKIAALAKALHTTPEYIMGWEDKNSFFSPEYEKYGIMPITVKNIPLLGEISCGEPVFASEDRQSYVAAGVNVKADFCLKAKGDSMINARIYDGDIVFIEKCDVVENGTVAAVIIGDDALLKRVFFYPEQGKLLLVAENTKYPPLVYEGEELNTVKILGKAIAFQSDVR